MKIKNIFRVLACFLLEKCKFIRFFSEKDIQYFTSIYIGEEAKRQLYQCRVRQLEGALAGLAGMIFFLCIFLLGSGNKSAKEAGYIQRPDYGEGTKKVSEELLLTSEDGKEKEEKMIEFRVQEKAYTQREWENVLTQIQIYLDDTVPGNNPSLEHVTQKLIFPKSFYGTSATISWERDSRYINTDGSLKNTEDNPKIPEEGIITEITAHISCQNYQAEYSFSVHIFPVQYTFIEQAWHKLTQQIEKKEENTRGKGSFELPEKVNGYFVSIPEKKDNTGAIFISLGCLVALLLALLPIRQVRDEAKHRERQLLMDYPKLVNKFVLLTGAGLTIRGVFERIAYEYENKQKKGSAKRYVYEEIAVMVRMMENGGSEAVQIEHLGRRIRLPEYLRFTALLLQNQKKGSEDLLLLLEAEAVAAMEKNKEHIRVLGEEAGTKLLLPMAAMMGIVFAVIMIPAFMGFS